MTEPEQLTLVREHLRRSTPPVAPGPAAAQPVARVLVDIPLAHLDRPFDYLVKADQSDDARPGARVKVRFAGKEVDGFVLDRVDRSDHEGTLTPLRRVVSPEPVLTPEIARLCRQVAERYAGTTSDVLRLAVPKRHARVEREAAGEVADVAAPAQSGALAALTGGAEYLRHLGDGGAPRAVWAACPGVPWTDVLVDAAAATLVGGRSALLVVPDVRDVHRLVAALAASGLGELTVGLTADLGPAPRYRAFLGALRGMARIVVGTRAAVFAPVRRLGLVAVWDDGDDLLAEPRAPYPHAREVLALRAHLEQVALLVGGYARTAEGAALVESGWAQSLEPTRDAVRTGAPRIHVTGETEVARLPAQAFEAARDGLKSGPVLVQVPRGGYLPALACVRCRLPARCGHCHGPLALGRGHRTAACGWCGRAAVRWRCENCEADRFRAPVVGSQRTAEELGRAFPAVPVVSSAGGRVKDTVPDRPALVVSTPGAEPVADGVYAAALILDSWLALTRPGLRTPEESLRRWFNAAALVRPAEAGGRVVVVGDPGVPSLQALVRWDPVGAAERELADRASAHLPPAARLAVVSGPSDAVAGLLPSLELPPGAEVLGPLPVERDADGEVSRAVVRVPRDRGAALSVALKHAQATRSAHKQPHLRMQVDPVELG
ncbi:MAG: primosome assembly protein PriA [Propionibacteriales bacterium]|nr:primosome assembly protein PriA [Propionibacteriales bacterium]